MPDESKYLDYLKRATADLRQANKRVRELEGADREPIAVIGMACRFPGGINTPEDLWTLLAEDGDAIGEFPTDRGWDLDAMYDPDPDRQGSIYAREGGFLHDAGRFDASFFGMSPREALATDPQQRLMLQIAWEAFERARIDPASVSGQEVGVFVGAAATGYGSVAVLPEGVEGHLLTGTSTSVVSGRIAFVLGLKGPAVTVDTACSSSLVGAHLAMRALRKQECSLALAGGVTVMPTPGMFLEFSRQRGLAPNGRCKPFAEAADGTGWSEGAGLLLLERLSDAEANGHPVLAVLRGSAVNSDGASNGLTAPNGPSQRKVIAKALADARLTAADVDAVEAHGTGTTLGDPIEAQALLATYGKERTPEKPLWLGSVKSNLGHTQAAAGVAGMMKVVLALGNESLPRSLHIDEPTRHVEWDDGTVRLLTDAQPWPASETPRRAAVSSFGISGTNAHIIIEQAPVPETDAEAEPEETPARPDAPLTWLLSAKTEQALAAQAGRLLAHVTARPDLHPADLAHALATTRTSFEYRAAAVGDDAGELAAALSALAAGEESAAVVRGRNTGKGKLAFLFSGQGAQRAGMGRGLYEAFPVFAEALDEVCAAFDLGRPLREVIFEDGDTLGETAWTQPALFAVETALFRLLGSLGVTPDLLLGHSIGELTAAHVAGMLSLKDAAALVTARARLMQACPSGGAMISLQASEDEVRPLLRDGVSIAALNGPSATVVSGDEEAAEAIAAEVSSWGRKTKRLRVSHAFHSPHMDGMLEEFTQVASGVEFAEPRLPIVSNVTGALATAGELRDPAYWAKHVRGGVRFHSGVEALLGAGATRFLELGPDPVLTAMTREALPSDRDLFAGCLLREGRPEPRTLVTALAGLHAHGRAVDWRPLTGGQPVPLPTYAFQQQRFWLESAVVADEGLAYRSAWVPASLGQATPPASWLVVVPDEGVPDDLAASVAETLGADVVTVSGLRERDAADLGGILSLLALDERMRDGVPEGVTATLDLLGLVRRTGLTAPVWLATSGAVAVSAGDGPRNPVQAAMCGLGRSLAVEDPGRRGGLVDLPEDPDKRALRLLTDVVGTPGGEFAIRRAGVFTRRLRRATADGRSWTPDGPVLITGGTGALGARVARWLVAEGARRIVLLSRTGANAPGAEELTTELTEAGANVTVAECDAADRDRLAELLDRLDAEGDGIRAVVHAAGVLDDGTLDTLTPERFATVLRPKMVAAANLHELTRERDLSAFVLFSSLAATTGSAGQANYAAANAYLDALAEHRASAGLPALSVAWGPWAGTGMAGDEATAARLRRGGLPPLSEGPALAALGRAIGGAATVAIADIDWSVFGDPADPLVSELPEVRGARGRDTAPEETVTEILRGVPEHEREHRLLELVRVHSAAALGHAGPDDVAPDRAFGDLGFDSLTALELRNRLSSVTGVALPSTLIFDHPTPVALARHLLSGIDVGAAPEAGRKVSTDEPIAIVGIGCRFPGGVRSPEEFWDLLAEGRDAITTPPADRGWPGSVTATVRGAFLGDATEFDAAFFGISPREALAMDPQQRLLLETAWEALEHAGMDPLSVRESETGVFIGTNGQDYGALLRYAKEDVEGHAGIGNAAAVLAGRLSYVLGLHGPAFTVDTACSSALVAMHSAGQALRSGECSMALAGGITVMSTPGAFAEFGRQGGLSADGRCKAFGAGADGTGWGEGVGVLVLERLSDARRNGHRVLALVRGSAVNQDGASNGLTAPNGPAQQRVIQQALAASGVAAGDVDAIEAHGTGTELGDPIEAQALMATYGRDRERPLWLGSVKSNIGHTQAAAGVAGVIKMVEAMNRGLLPRTLHAEEPSPHIDWSAAPVRLPSETVDWPATGEPRRAGVSSFGVSGTNAHVILEQGTPVPERDDAPDEGVHAWVLSARGSAGLAAQAARLKRHLETASVRPADLAVALGTARAALPDRAAVVGTGLDDLRSGLDALSAGRKAPGVLLGTAGSGGRLAFLFTGQGSQRLGMGTGLYEAYPVFAEAFDEVCSHFDGPVREVIEGDGERLDRTGFAQPALFAVEVALARLWESWGVRPEFVAGHSIGEFAAAYLAGVFDLAGACALVEARGRLMEALPDGGAMLAVAATEDEVRAVLDGDVGIAAVNGDQATVVSGAEEAVAEVERRFGEESRKTRRLRVSHAFHSTLMEPMLDEFAEVAAKIDYAAPSLGMVSTVTGEIAGDEVATPDYWVGQVRSTVRFADAVRTLADRRVTGFLEVGPGHALAAMTSEITAGRTVVAGLRAGDDEPGTLVRAAAALHVGGFAPDWREVFPAGDAAAVGLPTYAFQPVRFWPELDMPGEERDRLRYRVDWLPVSGRTAVPSGTWLLVTPETGNPLAETLTARGLDVRTVAAGTDREDLAARLRDSGTDTADTADIAGVLALPSDLDHTLALVQALGDAAIGAPLWLTTTEAVAAGGVTVREPERHEVWGFGLVAGLEHPDRWGGLIDLPETVDERAAGLLLSALTGAYGDTQLAVRSSGVLARRLARDPATRTGTEWTPSGTVLITGGSGALAAEVARWAAGNGAERVLLLSRSGAAAADLGDAVVPVACDVTDRAALAKVIEDIPEDRPLTAVVHAAGVLDDATIGSLTPSRVHAVLTAKVEGARNLDELTAGLDLDAFVLFSSLAATVGSAGQANYAAANAFLDAFAHARRAAGRTVTSVAWGPWAGEGMAGGGEIADRMRRNGMNPLAAATAIGSLRDAVGSGDVQVAVADIDWERFGTGYLSTPHRALLSGLVRADAAPAEADESLLAGLAEMPEAELNRTLLRLVREHAAAVLGHDGVDGIGDRTPFKDLGFDSLTAVEFRNSLATTVGLTLPSTLIFDHPTPVALTALLREELVPAPPDPAERVGRLLDELEAGLAELPESDAGRAELLVRVRRLLARPDTGTGSLENASQDEVFDFIDQELGLS